MEGLKADIAELKVDFDRKIRAFSLEYLSRAGRRFGNIPEWETRLSVKGRGEISLFRRRGPGDSNQERPGSYIGQLSDASLLDFIEALDASGIESYTTEAPGPRDPVTRLEILLGGRLYSFAWGISRHPASTQMARVKTMLANWTLAACPSPLWSLTFVQEDLQFSQGRLHARLRIENTGSQGIRIIHPASQPLVPEFGIHLKYGEVQLIEDGFTPDPIEIRIAKLPVVALDHLELVDLLPGRPFYIDFSALLEGDAPRGWIGKFVFMHYLPADSLAGQEVFNGALFTEEISW